MLKYTRDLIYTIFYMFELLWHLGTNQTANFDILVLLLCILELADIPNVINWTEIGNREF